MSESSKFVSVFRKNGRPILPPAMTPKRRAEMQEYKLKALAIEKKLLEKKTTQEISKDKSDISKNETLTGRREESDSVTFYSGNKSSDNARLNMDEEDKENDTYNAGSKSISTSMNTTNAFKSALAERTCLHSNNSEVNSMPCRESAIMDADVQQEEESCSVVPTNSTDLQQYLDSTLGDVSPDFEGNFDHSENAHLVGNYECEEEGICRMNALLALESKLAAWRFSPVVDLSKDIPKLILHGKSDSVSIPMSECSSEKADILSVKTPNFQGGNTKCTPVPCLIDILITDPEAKEVEPSGVPDSDVKQVSNSSSEKKVPSNFEYSPPMNAPPMLVRRGSYTLDSPSPTLLANIHKYSVDDLPKSSIQAEASRDEGRGVKGQPTEKSISGVAVDKVQLPKKASKNNLETGTKSKTSNIVAKGRSVFERLAADAARKIEARRKPAKDGPFKIPEVKKVPKSVKGLRSAVSINNIRATAIETHKKSLSTARRCNSDVNIPYSVVKAISTKNNPAASTQSLKKQSSVDSKAPPHLQKPHNVEQVDAVAAQKRKRRRWTERWEGWTKAIEPINRSGSSDHVSDKGEKVSAKVSESSKETTLPEISLDKSPSNQIDNLTSTEVEEREIDLCLSNISEIEHVNVGLSVEVPEHNVILVNEKDVGCLGESIPMKEKKDSDNLLIAKQASQVLHSPKAISEIPGEGIPKIGEDDSKPLNDCQTKTPEVNVISDVRGEQLSKNECHIPETPQEVALNPKEFLEPCSAKTNSVSAGGTSLDSSLEVSPERNSINMDEKSSIKSSKIPHDLQHTIESLPETPLGRHTAKDIALNILSRVIEEQDKAMQNLLEENRKREENIQKKFQEQLKYLVGKLTRLVQAMPSPQTKDGSGLQILSPKSKSGSDCTSNNEEIYLTIPSSIIRTNQSPCHPNIDCGMSLNAVSTPLPHIGVIEKNEDYHLTLPTPELVTSLSPSKHVDAKSIISIEHKTSDMHENHDETLKSPDLKDITNVICTPYQTSYSNKSCSTCSGENSIHSSTLKDELKSIEVILNDEKSDTTEYISSRKKDATNSSQDLEQSMRQSMSNKELYDSNSEVTLHDLKSSTAIEGCKTQNVDLDLSGILEMEYQGENTSHLPVRLVPSNALPETNSSSLSSMTDSKVQMNYGFLVDELALHRKKYEEDVLRLDESTPRCPSKMFFNSGNLITPFSARKDDAFGECQILPKKSPIESVTKFGNQSSIRLELPDLKSDVMALHTYLGAETPSTGPVTLETPLSTPACVLGGRLNPQIDNEKQVASSIYVNLSQDQTKEWDLGKTDIDFLRLKPNEEKNEEIDPLCDPQALVLHIGSAGRTPESLSGTKYLTPESCSSSMNYVSAASGSPASRSLGDVFNSEKKKRFAKLSGLVRGYFTRRLLKTARVLGIKATIQDSIETALKLHSEVSEENDVAAADVLLHGRILAQLSAAYNELHHIFFELPVKEQMAIISNDRLRLQSRSSTPVMYDPSPRPALLSAVTLKTLQRRFGDKIPAKKDAPSVPAKKKESLRLKEKSAVERNTKLNSRKLEEGSYYPRPTRAKSFTITARRSVKKTVEATKNTQLATRSSAVSGKVQLKNNKKKGRRSSSTGEINRKPWR